MGLIDSHAHLTDARFAEEVDEVVSRALAGGLEAIVTIGTNVEDSRAALEIAGRFAAVHATVGIHPHAAGAAADSSFDALRDLAAAPGVVGIGETGLDYHYDFSPRTAQRDAFGRQLDLAAELGLPVVVHSREADADLGAILRERGAAARGVLHCFSGGPELLESALEAGWYVSFAGMITFPKYDAADLLRRVPADRLLVETDSPYLSPVPFRGKRNEPERVGLVARRAAELRGEDPQALARATTANARRFYDLAP
jgi:TatD DNase family protein